MPELNERRRFLKQIASLAAASFAAAACGDGKTPTAPHTAALPPTSAPSATTLPTVVQATRTSPAAAVSTSGETAATNTAAATAAASTTVPTGIAAAPTPAAFVAPASPPGLSVAHGSGADPAELTRRAIEALGGIARFVKPGADVIVKPNICVAYHGPEYATTTNPDVVAAVVMLCLDAGAKQVRVMDAPFGGTAKNAYDKSGIAHAVAAAGGQMEIMNRMRYRSLPISSGRRIKEWPVYGDALDADVLINIPIAKDHGSTRLSLGMKNLMGLIQNRNSFHSRGLDQCIADLSTALRPQLIVVDAVRILTRNGPTGGNLADVKQTDTVIASTDPVAADAYAATLFGMAGRDIGYIRLAAEMGLGEMDLRKIDIAEVQV